MLLLPPNKHAFTAKAVWADFCNTSATGVKRRLRVQVLTGGWTDDSFSIHICGMQAYETSLEFSWLWMGNAAKGGMEIYTPVHMDCMCYVSGCNLHGGHNMTLSMVYLGRTLKLMQNGLRTTGIGYNTVKMRFMCM